MTEINKVIYDFTTPSHNDTKKNLLEFLLKLAISLIVTLIVAYFFIPRFFGIDKDENFGKKKTGSWVNKADFYFALYLSLISMCIALVVIILIIMTTKHPIRKLHVEAELDD